MTTNSHSFTTLPASPSVFLNTTNQQATFGSNANNNSMGLALRTAMSSPGRAPSLMRHTVSPGTNKKKISVRKGKSTFSKSTLRKPRTHQKSLGSSPASFAYASQQDMSPYLDGILEEEEFETNNEEVPTNIIKLAGEKDIGRIMDEYVHEEGSHFWRLLFKDPRDSDVARKLRVRATVFEKRKTANTVTPRTVLAYWCTLLLSSCFSFFFSMMYQIKNLHNEES